jgi:tetratricopeptide (TPR) repeat protein
MFDKKKCSGASLAGLALLTLALAGCSPNGPDALKRGLALLDQGDNAGAYDELKLATTLLRTNAVAWDCFGVAAQRAGQPVEAVNAYSRALELDRDLVEAHFNLGCLYLEQNQADSARTELAAYTMRRPNDPEGWRKLGAAQLRLGETIPAERSYSAVLSLKPRDSDSYNALGLASVQLGRPHDAVKFFAAAIQVQPDNASAIFNLAATSQEYLRDHQTALTYYEKYLALSPRPAHWDEVNAIVTGLQASAPPSPAATAVTPETNPRPATGPETATTAVRTVPGNPAPSRVVSPPRPPVLAQRPTQPAATVPARPVSSQPQVVRLAPETPILAQPGKPAPAAPVLSASAPTVEIIKGDSPSEESKPSLWQRLKPSNWFRDDSSDTNSSSEFVQSGVTPLHTTPVVPVESLETFTPYRYENPPVPAPGDHRAASGAYTKAQLFEQDERWAEAMLWYGSAAEFDPSWFDALYKEGLLAERTRNFARALSSYERALALRPDSTTTRYNFALTLRSAGHPQDAANELGKILAAHPEDVRARLALANLYAQTLHQPIAARQEYNRVLALQPNHPQAGLIRAWLKAN